MVHPVTEEEVAVPLRLALELEADVGGESCVGKDLVLQPMVPVGPYGCGRRWKGGMRTWEEIRRSGVGGGKR